LCRLRTVLFRLLLDFVSKSHDLIFGKSILAGKLVGIHELYAQQDVVRIFSKGFFYLSNEFAMVFLNGPIGINIQAGIIEKRAEIRIFVDTEFEFPIRGGFTSSRKTWEYTFISTD